MGKIINQMLENYLSNSDVKLQKGPDSLSFIINSAEGISRTILYNILPYMHLIFFDIHASSLPGEIAENSTFHPLQFNYCIGGRIEMLLEDNSYIYLKENDFCISRQTSKDQSYFPTKYYHGITIYFDPDFFTHSNQKVSELFNLNLSDLPKRYFSKKDTYITEAGAEIEAILKHLWQLYEAPSTFYMKLCVLDLLYNLLNKKNVCPEKAHSFYTSTQVEIAKKAEKILTFDLKQHIPIKQVATQFGISETSLKNYFRGVYGKNISDYLRNQRMNLAQKLLTNTKLSISEIALQIGYSKQGKFAEVFRKEFQMNPLEYRRKKKLEQLT